ncbi:MAG: ARMT1-like domain-containing protein [Methanobrevibacter sp.]|nr:ARMT1-like domain-containing protein [Methanobrevibacter sp.]
MKVYYECGACFIRQAREAMDLATDDDELKINIMNDIFKFLSENYNKNASGNKVGSALHRMIKEKTACEDPYIKEKALGNKIALEILEKVQKLLKKDNSLENYIKIAIVGNILDFGALELDFNHQELIFDNLNKELAINNIDELKEAISKHKELLYLVDNTGEIVFDKLLIEKLLSLGLDITVVVKEKPILNDACLEDAVAIGLDKIAKITSLGTDSVGIIYEEASDDFKKIFDNADFIIAKGLGNYEGLTEINLENKDVFCLLCAKCSAIAKDIGVEEKENVLLKL